MKCAIVILNWNGKKFLRDFLPSVISKSNHPIIIADNASSDDSIEFLQLNHPNIQIIQLEQNYGFAEGYNRALEQIEAEYYVLLNSDIEVTVNWLDICLEHLDKNPNVAACQPKILSYHEKNKFEYAGACGGYLDYLGYPFCRGRIFDTTEIDSGQYDNIVDVFWATGACLIIRSKVYREAGGLDKDFFAHQEEIDLCWRIGLLGYKIQIVPKASVYHVGGGTLNKSNPFKTYLNFRNNLSMLSKNLDPKNLLFTIITRLILDGVAAIKFLFSSGFGDFSAVLKAHFSYYGRIGRIIKKRKAFAQTLKTKSRSFKDQPEIYSKSIMLKYYLQGIKKYHKL